MKNIKRITKKVYANEILQNTRIHKNGKSAAEKRKSEYSQNEKSQNQTTEDQEKTHNKKCLRKQDIAKKIKLQKMER